MGKGVWERGSEGPCPLPVPPHAHQPRCSLNPLLLGFHEASSNGQDESLIALSALLPSKENWRWGRKFQASHHGLFFFVMTIRHSGASRSPPRVASLEQKTLLAPRKLQGFQELRGRNQGERPVFLYYFTPFNEKRITLMEPSF